MFKNLRPDAINTFLRVEGSNSELSQAIQGWDTGRNLALFGTFYLNNSLTINSPLSIEGTVNVLFNRILTLKKVNSITGKIQLISGLVDYLTGNDAGRFDSSSGWSVGTGWTISNGVASHSVGNVGTLSYPACSAVAGRTYLIRYTIGGTPNGGIIVSFGGVSGFRRTAAGTYIEMLTATGSGALTFTPEPNFGGTLDNVEVFCLSSVNFIAGSVEYVNPIWFGAVGDDSTDNYLALNAAFFQLGAIGRVYIPAGVYRFSQPLFVPYYGLNGAFGGAVVIEGSSMSDTILKYTGSRGYGIHLAKDGHAEMFSTVSFTYELHNYLSFKDCQIQANNTTGGGIVLGGAGHIQLEHLAFSNISNSEANAILLRATEHEIYHSNHVNDTTKDFTNSGLGQAYAIRFRVRPYISGGRVRAVKVRLGRTGSPQGTISASIYTDSSGVPGTMIGSSSNAVACSSLTTNSNGSEVEFTFNYGGFPTIDHSTNYWVVLTTSGYTYTDGVTEVWIRTRSNDSSNEFAEYDGANWSTTNDGSDVAVVVRFAVGILNNFDSIHTAKVGSINRAIRVEDRNQVIINNSEIYGKYGLYSEGGLVWCDNTEFSTTDSGGQNAVIARDGFTQWNKCYVESGSTYAAEFYGGLHVITQSVFGYLYWDSVRTTVKIDDSHSNFPKVGDPKVRDNISYCFFPRDPSVSVHSNVDIVSDSNALTGEAWRWETDDRYRTVTVYFRIIAGAPYVRRYLPRGLYLVTVYARATNTVSNDLWIGCHYYVGSTPTYKTANTYTLQGGAGYVACQTVFTIDESVYTGGGETYISVSKWETGANTIYVSHITVERILGTDMGLSEQVCFNAIPSDADNARASSLWFMGRTGSGTSVTHMAQIMGCHDGTSADRKGKLFFRVNAGTDNPLSLTTVATVTAETFRINTGGLAVGNNGSNMKQIVCGTVNIDPPSIAATSTGSVTFTLSGAAVGDRIIMEPPTDLHDDLIFKGARVTGANTVTVYIYNPMSSAIDDTSRTWNYTWIDLT